VAIMVEAVVDTVVATATVVTVVAIMATVVATEGTKISYVALL
jgi:hypothetical protein